MIKRYCEKCGNAQKTKTIQKTETFIVNDDAVEASVELLICAQCDHVLSRKEPDEKTLFDAYRRKRHLLFPHEILSIRMQYELSIHSFASLLHWGEKTVSQLETGKMLPSLQHNNLLILLSSPENMRIYLEHNRECLSEKNNRKLLQTIDHLALPTASRRSFFRHYFSEIPNVYNGYKPFDYRIASAMVMYFAQIEKHITKAKLGSLMYYADMSYYERYGMSMSGLCYLRRSFGAAAENMDILYATMEEDHLICIEIVYLRKNERYEVINECALPPGILNRMQEEVLWNIYQNFKEADAKKVYLCLKKQDNYRKAKNGKYISYGAVDLSISCEKTEMCLKY